MLRCLDLRLFQGAPGERQEPALVDARRRNIRCRKRRGVELVALCCCDAVIEVGFHAEVRWSAGKSVDDRIAAKLAAAANSGAEAEGRPARSPGPRSAVHRGTFLAEKRAGLRQAGTHDPCQI